MLALAAHYPAAHLARLPRGGLPSATAAADTAAGAASGGLKGDSPAGGVNPALYGAPVAGFEAAPGLLALAAGLPAMRPVIARAVGLAEGPAQKRLEVALAGSAAARFAVDMAACFAEDAQTSGQLLAGAAGTANAVSSANSTVVGTRTVTVAEVRRGGDRGGQRARSYADIPVAPAPAVPAHPLLLASPAAIALALAGTAREDLPLVADAVWRVAIDAFRAVATGTARAAHTADAAAAAASSSSSSSVAADAPALATGMPALLPPALRAQLTLGEDVAHFLDLVRVTEFHHPASAHVAWAAARVPAAATATAATATVSAPGAVAGVFETKARAALRAQASRVHSATACNYGGAASHRRRVSAREARDAGVNTVGDMLYALDLCLGQDKAFSAARANDELYHVPFLAATLSALLRAAAVVGDAPALAAVAARAHALGLTDSLSMDWTLQDDADMAAYFQSPYVDNSAPSPLLAAAVRANAARAAAADLDVKETPLDAVLNGPMLEDLREAVATEAESRTMAAAEARAATSARALAPLLAGSRFLPRLRLEDLPDPLVMMRTMDAMRKSINETSRSSGAGDLAPVTAGESGNAPTSGAAGTEADDEGDDDVINALNAASGGVRGLAATKAFARYQDLEDFVEERRQKTDDVDTPRIAVVDGCSHHFTLAARSRSGNSNNNLGSGGNGTGSENDSPANSTPDAGAAGGASAAAAAAAVTASSSSS